MFNLTNNNSLIEEDMKEYYYKTSNNKFKNSICIEPCNIKTGIMIGSEDCSRCENCIDGSVPPNGKGWIKCKKIKLEA